MKDNIFTRVLPGNRTLTECWSVPICGQGLGAMLPPICCCGIVPMLRGAMSLMPGPGSSPYPGPEPMPSPGPRGATWEITPDTCVMCVYKKCKLTYRAMASPTTPDVSPRERCYCWNCCTASCLRSTTCWRCSGGSMLIYSGVIVITRLRFAGLWHLLYVCVCPLARRSPLTALHWPLTALHSPLITLHSPLAAHSTPPCTPRMPFA